MRGETSLQVTQILEGKRGKGKGRREDTQNSKDKVVWLLGSESQGWSHGEVFRRDQICN